MNVASGQTDECEDIKVEPMELHKTAFAKPLMIVSLIRKIQLQGRIFLSPPEKGSRVEARRRMGALKWSHRLIGPLYSSRSRDVLQDGYNRIRDDIIYMSVL